MTLTSAAWLAMAAYALHIMEEFSFDWRDWAREVIKLPVEWPDFYVTNAVVVSVGIAQAMLAATMPWVPLSFTGLMLINALFFHIMPMIRTKGRYSPGAATAVLLFLPSVAFSWSTALSTGAADVGTIILGVVIGAVLMAYPIAILHLRQRPYFNQLRAKAPAPSQL
jgi:hypothetical protein